MTATPISPRAVLDEFIGQFGNVPVYGALARERREKLAEQAREPGKEPAIMGAVRQSEGPIAPRRRNVRRKGPRWVSLTLDPSYIWSIAFPGGQCKRKRRR
jgi:hypothetical protein